MHSPYAKPPLYHNGYQGRQERRSTISPKLKILKNHADQQFKKVKMTIRQCVLGRLLPSWFFSSASAKSSSCSASESGFG